MKKLITGALVLALTIGAAQAQTTSADKHKGHKKEHKMHNLDGLNLTEEQKAKLKTLHEEQKKEMEALKANKPVDKEQMKAIHEKYRQQMQSILTPAQKEQMDKMKDKRSADGKKGHFRKGDDKKGDLKHGNDFQKELGLSQDQKDRMAKIRADFKSQFEALRKDDKLTKEQKRSKMQELMKAQQDQMKTVLTKEQLDKMQSMRKERSSKSTK